VNIHVCECGSAWERRHLLFRDYLRASPDVRDAYARLKNEMSVRYRTNRYDYTDAKGPFIREVQQTAEQWAAASAGVRVRPTPDALADRARARRSAARAGGAALHPRRAVPSGPGGERAPPPRAGRAAAARRYRGGRGARAAARPRSLVQAAGRWRDLGSESRFATGLVRSVGEVRPDTIGRAGEKALTRAATGRW